MSERNPKYSYDDAYSYLKEVSERTGTLLYDLRTVLKDYGIIYLGLDLKPGYKVLDVGSCIGSLGHFLKYGGIKTYGIDLNTYAIKKGRTIFGTESQNISIAADALNIPFPTGYFDAVVTEDVFEHFPNPNFAEAAFSEMQRVMKPERSKMFHKITVAEDKKHIDADKTHFLKWTTGQWINFFGNNSWATKSNPDIKVPVLGKTYHGYFLIDRK